jgi:hypothetical protein
VQDPTFFSFWLTSFGIHGLSGQNQDRWRVLGEVLCQTSIKEYGRSA